MSPSTFTKKDAKAFVSKLRKLNKTMKFTTHGQLADFLGLKTRRVQAWMIGENLPTEEAIRKIHDHFGRRLDRLAIEHTAIFEFLG